jgi:tetratricopeptide (TPR) repeat protein
LILPARLSKASSVPSIADCLSISNTAPMGRPGIVPALERCRSIIPNDTEVMADLAGEYESAGRVELAEKTYQEALAIDPAYAEVRLRLGRLMLRRGAADEAKKQATAALTVQPNREAFVELLEDATRAAKR